MTAEIIDKLLKLFKPRKSEYQLQKEREEEERQEKMKRMMEEYRIERGQRLTNIRKQLKLSTKKMAEKLGVNEELITQFEEGHADTLRNPGLIYNLFSRLNINPVYIIGGVGEPLLKEEVTKAGFLDLEKYTGNTLEMITYMKLFPLMSNAIFSYYLRFLFDHEAWIISDIRKALENDQLRRKQ